MVWQTTDNGWSKKLGWADKNHNLLKDVHTSKMKIHLYKGAKISYNFL
jgi:hypothetical protein